MKASLYIHIPFCTHKCLYCDFYSVPLCSCPEPEASVRGVLNAEIKQLEYFLRVWQPEAIPSLYVGGGTPSAVDRRLLSDFLDAVLERLPGGAAPNEFTVEANPETLDAEFLSLCAVRGVTRLSLGIQSFRPRFLEYSGRAAGPEDNRRALELLSRGWTQDLNLDLLYGFPGQKSGEILEDARSVLSAAPGHLSVYALTVEEGTPLFQKIAAGEALPVNEDRQESLRAGLHRLLCEHGYENYEISNYALPGKRCVHNLAYWKLYPYMGIGPAAVSTLPAAPFLSKEADASERNCPRETPPAVRLSGKRNITAYTENPCVLESEKISPKDFLADYILMGLRTLDGIDTQEFFRIFHWNFYENFSHAVEKNIRFIQKNRGSSRRFSLTDAGRRILNRILLDFFNEIDKKSHTGPLSWP